MKNETLPAKQKTLGTETPTVRGESTIRGLHTLDDREKQKKILRSEAHDICRVACAMIAARCSRLEMSRDFQDFRYVGQWLLEETVSQLQQRI